MCLIKYLYVRSDCFEYFKNGLIIIYSLHEITNHHELKFMELIVVIRM